MDKVLEKSKEFEHLVSTYDPVYKNLVIAVELVKKFIIQNKLIIYGGTAIDYALRLKGDKIYPDELLPDLDFYSPQNVEHSYQLADILYNSGYKDARAINAQHMETMRVDSGDSHFIADITYRPAEIFDKLPYLVYNEMRIIDPSFQRLDIHSSLSYPYDVSGLGEVIFNRWSKDVRRFNNLAKYYKPEGVFTDGNIVKPRKMTVPVAYRKYVLAGFAAYSLIYSEYLRSIEGWDPTPARLAEVLPTSLEVQGDVIQFDTLEQKLHVTHYNLEKVAGEIREIIGGEPVTAHYEPYINMIPERLEMDIPGAVGGGAGQVVVYSTKNRLLSYNSIEKAGVKFRIVNIQSLLRNSLSLYFTNREFPKIAATYLYMYTSLINMIANYESYLSTKTAEEAETLAESSVLYPTIETYGNENISLAREIALNRLGAELNGTTPYKTPYNYYPERSIAKGLPHPTFDPEQLEFFRESGRKIG